MLRAAVLSTGEFLHQRVAFVNLENATCTDKTKSNVYNLAVIRLKSSLCKEAHFLSDIRVHCAFDDCLTEHH